MGCDDIPGFQAISTGQHEDFAKMEKGLVEKATKVLEEHPKVEFSGFFLFFFEPKCMAFENPSSHQLWQLAHWIEIPHVTIGQLVIFAFRFTQLVVDHREQPLVHRWVTSDPVVVIFFSSEVFSFQAKWQPPFYALSDLTLDQRIRRRSRKRRFPWFVKLMVKFAAVQEKL